MARRQELVPIRLMVKAFPWAFKVVPFCPMASAAKRAGATREVFNDAVVSASKGMLICSPDSVRRPGSPSNTTLKRDTRALSAPPTVAKDQVFCCASHLVLRLSGA